MTAKITPPMTGEGIQKVSRNLTFFLRNPPKYKTPTATARV
jgi:hypothetical protein